MKHGIKTLLILLFPVLAYAQPTVPDSLKQALAQARTDSARYWLQEKLRDYYVEGNLEMAIYYIDQNLAIAKKNNKLINEASDLDIKGYELYRMHKFPESYELLEQALKIAGDPENENKNWKTSKSSSSHKIRLYMLGMTLHDLGHLMGETGDVDQQIIEYRKAGRLAEEINDKFLLGLVNASLGMAYVKRNRIDSALTLEEHAEMLLKQVVGKPFLGYVYYNLGNIYLQKGNNALAIQYYHNALAINEQQNILKSMDYCYAALANYYLALKQPDSSLFYAKKMLQNLNTMGSKDLGDAYEDLHKSYQLRHQADSAYRYQGLALTAKDSSYSATIKSLADFEKISFKEQLRLRDLEKEQELIQTRIRTYVLLAAVSILILLTVIFYRNNRQKQKANHALSEQKEEIISQRDTLGRALEELKVTQNQLVQREKMASLGELTAGIAHEIQNPLNFVNNFSEVNEEMLGELKAESRKPKAERDEQLEIVLINDLIENEKKINHHGKRADFIVKGMLEHSRTSTGEKTLTNINVLADEFLKLSYHGLRAKDKNFNAELITHFDETLPKVIVSQQDIGRVMLNLFNNAFYAVNQKLKTAGPDYKPEVSVTTSSENGNIVIKVKDNGNGIPEAIKDKIMQPFFTTKPTGEGTGLGLSLSYDILVKGHGGEITVESKVGQFTEFTITLPV